MTPVVRGREGAGSCGEAEKTTIQCEESRVERGQRQGPHPALRRDRLFRTGPT